MVVKLSPRPSWVGGILAPVDPKETSSLPSARRPGPCS